MLRVTPLALLCSRFRRCGPVAIVSELCGNHRRPTSIIDMHEAIGISRKTFYRLKRGHSVRRRTGPTVASQVVRG
jgi:hypothetical protein